MSKRMDPRVMEMLVKAHNRLNCALERLDAHLDALTHMVESGTLQGAEIADTANLALWALRCVVLAWRDEALQEEDTGHALWSEVAHHQLHLHVALGIDNEEADRFARVTEQVIADVRVFADQGFEPVTRRLHAEHAADLVDSVL